MYSVLNVKLQGTCQKEISLQVLEYIKKAKAWRNNSWGNDESGRPSSYLMEILVIKAYENGGG